MGSKEACAGAIEQSAVQSASVAVVVAGPRTSDIDGTLSATHTLSSTHWQSFLKEAVVAKDLEVCLVIILLVSWYCYQVKRK